MEETTIFHFVRHGEVENPNKVYYGRLPDFHLSQCGIVQVQATAKILRQYPVSAIFSSPLERGVETAELISKEFGGMPWEEFEELNEVCTPYDGQLIEVIEARNWDVYTENPPPFDQPADVLDRSLTFIRKVVQSNGGQHVVAATHGDLIAFLRLWSIGKPLEVEFKQELYKQGLTYGSISTFMYETSSQILKYLPPGSHFPGLQARIEAQNRR